MPALEEAPQLSQPVACASEDHSANFCGSYLERVPACVCHLGDVNESLHAAVHAQMRDHGTSMDDRADDLSQKGHVKRKHRKDNRRRKWEAAKLASQSTDPSKDLGNKFARGADAAGFVYKDLSDFYDSPDPEKPVNVKEAYKNIAGKGRTEHQAHHKDLPGHGMLIEFCTSENQPLERYWKGYVGHQHGVHVIRCTEKTLNVEDPKTEKALLDGISSKPGIDLLGSLPCGPWTQWQDMNAHKYGPGYVDRLEQSRRVSRRMLKRFTKIARATPKAGGRRPAAEWSLNGRDTALAGLSKNSRH